MLARFGWTMPLLAPAARPSKIRARNPRRRARIPRARSPSPRTRNPRTRSQRTNQGPKNHGPKSRHRPYPHHTAHPETHAPPACWTDGNRSPRADITPTYSTTLPNSTPTTPPPSLDGWKTHNHATGREFVNNATKTHGQGTGANARDAIGRRKILRRIYNNGE
jgi:hypothetical protein